MLEMKVMKNMELKGEVKKDNKTVMTLNASVSTDKESSSTVYQNIYENELYTANKKEIRKYIADFQNQVYDIEDELTADDLQK